MLTAEQLDAIEHRADAATPGPWTVDERGDVVAPLPPGSHTYRTCESVIWGDGAVAIGDDDAVFVSHAREDIPALLAEVDRLRKIVSDIQNILSWEPDPCPVHPEDDSPDDVTVCGWKFDIGQIRGILTAAGYDLTPQSEAGESDE